jgi:glycosyltransferase involved in cell wall biosynthesis
MTSNAPLISVITPFHNIENYLAECIESVLHQTYTNWEYVLVNNCSTDRSAEVAEHYVRRYPERLRLEHNATLLSQVRNYNQALHFVSPRSRYCKFVQADDWLYPQCLEFMVDVAESDRSVGVVGAYSIEGRTVEFDGLPSSSAVITGRNVCRKFFLEDLYVFGSPTQLLLRSDLVLGRSPFYDEADIPFEDAVVIFKLLKQWNFGFVHQVLTFSRRDKGSVMQALLDVQCIQAFRLLMLREFGSSFLDREEYRAALRRKERAYAQVLVDGVAGLRGRSFWQFHRSMLSRMGYRFASPRVWWLLFISVCNIALNPKRGLRLLYHGLRAAN